MLGRELKNIRVKAGYNQYELAEILGVTQGEIHAYESDFFYIPPRVEEAINKMVIKKSESVLTDKYFSRLLFLNNMLTGNEVVDDIYKNADWLKEYDGQRVQVKATTELLNKFSRNLGKSIKVNHSSKEYFLPQGKFGVFICKEEWLR